MEKFVSVRLLRGDEIECRVSTISEKGLSLLLFKDARVDQKILDETFTPFGWQRTHQSIDGNLYCTVQIWNEEKKQWIAKQDVGTRSYSEKEKGQASDSFKRACFNWGIGRELYTAPFIWIPSSKTEIQKRNDKYVTSDRFSVQKIAYNEQREIEELVIVNGKGLKVYEKKGGEAKSCDHKTATSAGNQKTKPTKVQIHAIEKELERTGVTMETVLERYSIKTLEEMTLDVYLRAINGLQKTKDKELKETA